ncbi:unnamed protein product, partial [Arabidopsis halleri]
IRASPSFGSEILPSPTAKSQSENSLMSLASSTLKSFFSSRMFLVSFSTLQ